MSLFCLVSGETSDPTLLETWKDHKTAEKFGGNACVTRCEIFDISSNF